MLGERNFVKTGTTLANIAGSGRMANPLGHTKRHVRNLIVALDNAKEDVLAKALKAAIGVLRAPTSMTTWLDDIMRALRQGGLACPCRVSQQQRLPCAVQGCSSRSTSRRLARANRRRPASARRRAWWLV